MPSIRPRSSKRQAGMPPRKRPPSSDNKHVQIRSVWADNLESEFALIRSVASHYPFATIDTEFPGTIHHHPTKPYYAQTPKERYALLKSNVDELHLIQLGLTLSDSAGRLPGGTVWEFNFNDFDPKRDPHNPKSIEFLRSHGTDFEKNCMHGIESRRFAELMWTSGLVCNGSRVCWLGFGAGYDFAYLMKVMTGRRLPATMGGFVGMMGGLFGGRVFDLKVVAGGVMRGGLEEVAGRMEVRRAAGGSHQAGSDSLLTWQAFLKMVKGGFGGLEMHSGVICGLQVY